MQVFHHGGILPAVEEVSGSVISTNPVQAFSAREAVHGLRSK